VRDIRATISFPGRHAVDTLPAFLIDATHQPQPVTTKSSESSNDAKPTIPPIHASVADHGAAGDAGAGCDGAYERRWSRCGLLDLMSSLTHSDNRIVNGTDRWWGFASDSHVSPIRTLPTAHFHPNSAVGRKTRSHRATISTAAGGNVTEVTPG